MATNYMLFSSAASSDSSSDDDSHSHRKLDFSYQDLDADHLEYNLNEMCNNDVDTEANCETVEKLLLYNNRLDMICLQISFFRNLKVLDLSNNMLRAIPDLINDLGQLEHLFVRNNVLSDDSFPKTLTGLARLREVNLSGNRLTEIPGAFLEVTSLRHLFIGGNRISEVTPAIKMLRRLRVLYLGGNDIKQLPREICALKHLQALILCDNRLESLPECICSLGRLECLQLHGNNLTTLPHGLVYLKSLSELSLRENPLVHRFVRDMSYQPSSLLELSAKIVKYHRVPFTDGDLPNTLTSYLRSARSCVNPKCKGVYFSEGDRVEHIKFVDFCGKYKIPLMQYLCSSRCKDTAPAFGTDPTADSYRMKKVLLG